MTAQQIQFVWPNTLIEIAIIVGLTFAVRWAVRYLISRGLKIAANKPTHHHHELDQRATDTLQRADTGASGRQAARIATVGSVLNSILDVVLLIIAVVTIRNALNVNIGPALASAGIGGVAIGFGAQSLIKDFISGIFMIFEDQYGVGDYITVGDLSGTVISVGFRITEIQDPSGQMWYVRNGEISKLGNVSQGWSTTYLEVPVALSESPTTVIDQLNKVLTSMDADPTWHAKLLEAPSVLGLSRFDSSTASYQVMFKTPANGQWDVGRELRARIIAAFQDAGIEAPVQIIHTSPHPSTSQSTPPQPSSSERTSPCEPSTPQQTDAALAAADDPQP